MNSVSRWRDSGHLERAVATAGGQEAFDTAIAAMLDDARVRPLAKMCRRGEDEPGASDREMATRSPESPRWNAATSLRRTS